MISNFKIQKRIRRIAFELNALAYLIQQQKSDEVPPDPKTIEDIQWGLAEVIRGLVRRLKRVEELLESSYET